jgi:lysophospholipase L1-like esterase
MRSAFLPALLALALSPLLRAEAPTQANRFEKEIAAFEAADKTSPPPQGAILFTGASGIKRWTTLAEDFPGLQVINRGFGGSQISDSIHFLDRVSVPYHPKTIVLQAGGNDINAGKPVAQVVADFKTWVDKVRAKLPGVKIVYLGQSPSPARWAQREQQKEVNRLIQEYIATGKNMAFVDLWDVTLGPDGQPRPELFVADKLHPSADGYRIRTKLLRPVIEAP